MHVAIHRRHPQRHRGGSQGAWITSPGLSCFRPLSGVPIYRTVSTGEAEIASERGASSRNLFGGADVEAVAEFDERLGAFYQREGMKASGWSEQVTNRLRSVSNLHGREEFVEELKRMGFGLL